MAASSYRLTSPIPFHSASHEEVARPEALHIFGTDRMSTEDLMLYFITPGVTPQEQAPQWVEWVNDSSANVVFGTAEAAAIAVRERTSALMPNTQGIDTTIWRTIPEVAAAAGKGLQLLFRLATTLDVKPPKRAASRWYGETDAKHNKGGGRRHSGGKMGGVGDRRDRRQQSSGPYSREERQGYHAKQIAESNLAAEGRKKSLAEAIAVKNAQIQGPSLADMAQGRTGVPTLADMASGGQAGSRRVEVASGGPTLADMARSSGGSDLRAMLGGRKSKGAKAEDAGGAVAEEPVGGTMSYAAVKDEQQAAAGAELAARAVTAGEEMAMGE